MEKGTYFFKTDCGMVRPKNEDNALIVENVNIGDTLMMVLDGMGGHNKGDKASQMALDIIQEKFKYLKKPFKTLFGIKRFISKAVKKANKEINVLGTNNIEYHEMGTTLILAYRHGNKVIMCNVGDSRFYAANEGNFVQVSEDQTYVQFLYKTGKIKKEDIKIHPKRHVLMNALGTYPTVSIVTKVIKKPMDKILLCSDGLYNMLSDDEINEVLQTALLTTEEKTKVLVKKANAAGGIDNIAIALWEE
jgi:serine/threonine protein phosphatase PrpC